MTEESTEKQENGNANGNGIGQEEKPKIGDEISTNEAQEEKIPYPKSVFFIVSNEFCERFSYYGMRTILSLYLSNILLFSESDSTVIYHTFVLLCYFFPLIGAIISDSWLGKFRTILYLSILYSCGNILLALSAAKPIGIPQIPFSLVALLLIAMGTGGIKPCVSSFGGDQFVMPQQEKQLVNFFSVFYFSINAGSLISTFLTPVLREDVECFGENSCYSLAFAIPGILMIVAVVIFVAGMRMYKIKTPEGNLIVKVSKCIWYGARKNMKSKEKVDHWLDHAVDKYGRTLVDDVKVALKAMLIFVPLPIFWALYDQQGSAWTFQANRMDGRLGQATILPDQMQVINPILILVFIPMFNYGVYPFFAKFNLLKTPLSRMIWGGFLAAVAFGISAGVSAALEATYPQLPADGECQLRIYNPTSCDFTVSIDNLAKQTKVGPMGYEYLKLDCSGTKNYTYHVEHCYSEVTSVINGTDIKLSEGTGYVLYPTKEGFVRLEDDISKPEDGFPKIRTLVDDPSADFNVIFYDDDEDALSVPSKNNTFQTIDPGIYKIRKSQGSQEFEFELGGVYTVLAQLSADSSEIEAAKIIEVTQPNSIHMLWLVPQYVIITAAEILLSITGLEFSYSQAPVSMKSLVSAVFLLTDAVGNVIIVIIESTKIFGKQSLDFTLYTGLMVVDMVLFAYMASKYTYVTINDEDEKDAKSVKSEKRLSSDKPATE